MSVASSTSSGIIPAHILSYLETILPEGVCLATTGSDARLEKQSAESPLELLFIRPPSPDCQEELGTDPVEENGDSSEECKTPFVSPKKMTDKLDYNGKIRAVFQLATEKYPRTFFSRYQVFKTNENPLSYKGESRTLIIPNRAIEAVPLAGDSKVMNEFVNRVQSSFRAISSQERKKFLDQFYTPAIRALKECIQGKCQAVDIQSGKLTYDGNRIRSSKFPLLRAVQYRLTRCLIEKRGELFDDFFANMPKPIDERIYWLSKNKLLDLSPEQAGAIVKAYKKAHDWYVLSQKEFEKGNSVITVDPKELSEVVSTIQSFVNGFIDSKESEKKL